MFLPEAKNKYFLTFIGNKYIILILIIILFRKFKK